MSTSGTPFPGRVDAPTNERPSTRLERRDGLNRASWSSPWARPNTDPRRSPRPSRHSRGSMTRSWTTCGSMSAPADFLSRS